MTVNHFHELIKKKITPLIINRSATTRIVDLVNLFRNSKFNRLSHDLEIIQNDFTFSKFLQIMLIKSLVGIIIYLL